MPSKVSCGFHSGRITESRSFFGLSFALLEEKAPSSGSYMFIYMIENLLCLAVILRSSFENGRDPRGHPVGSPLDLFKPWSMAAAVGVAELAS